MTKEIPQKHDDHFNDDSNNNQNCFKTIMKVKK